MQRDMTNKTEIVKKISEIRPQKRKERKEATIGNDRGKKTTTKEQQ